MAYVEPYELTKLDITALRRMDTMAVHLDAAAGTHSVEAIKRNDDARKSDPFASRDIRYEIAIPVSVYTASFAGGNDCAAAKCFAHLWNYPSQHCEVSSMLATLRAGDGVKFQFAADRGTHAVMARCGLHGDALQMLVYRKGMQVATFTLAEMVAPNNSARMVKGVPDSDWYKTEAGSMASGDWHAGASTAA